VECVRSAKIRYLGDTMKLHEINDNIHELEKARLDISLDIENINEHRNAIELRYLKDILFDPSFKNEKQRETKLTELLSQDKEWMKWDNLLFIAKKKMEENKVETGFYRRMWETERLLFISHNCSEHTE